MPASRPVGEPGATMRASGSFGRPDGHREATSPGKGPVDVPGAKTDPSLPPESVTPSEVLKATLARWGVSLAEVLGGARRRRVVLARRACVCALRQAMPSLTMADIGAELLIDHTTVIYALKKAGVR